MTATLPQVVVPYTEFLERRAIASELRRRRAPAPLEVEVTADGSATPLASEPIASEPAKSDLKPRGVKSPERAP